MNTTAQVISIVAAIAVLAVIGGWLALRQRGDLTDDQPARKTGRKTSLFSRQDARRKQRGARKTNQVGQISPPEWKENQSKGTPETDRAVSLPELKDSSSQVDKVVTLPPNGKNGRSKH